MSTLSRPLTIAMVAACPFPSPRGTPVRIRRMSEALARRGHDVHVVSYHLGEPLTEAPFKLHRTPRIPTYRKVAPGPSLQKLVVMDTLLTWRLRQVLQQYPVDIIHAHHYEGLMAALAATGRRGPPVIYDAHTALESELGHYMPHLFRHSAAKLGHWLDVALPPRAAQVITVSEALRLRLIRSSRVAPERLTVIGNGVEQAHFDIPLQHRAAAPSPETLIFTGNLAPYQGIDLMLQAFRLVLDRRPAARLLIVTDSSFASYEALTADLRIRNAIDVVDGGFSELPAHLAQAAIALNPRIHCHGTPMKLLNYLAAAKPIVSFHGSAHGLEHDKTAWLVPDGDIPAFASGILMLLDRPDMAQRLGTSARHYSEANVSWESTARLVENVYARTLEEARSTRTSITAPSGTERIV